MSEPRSGGTRVHFDVAFSPAGKRDGRLEDGVPTPAGSVRYFLRCSDSRARVLPFKSPEIEGSASISGGV